MALSDEKRVLIEEGINNGLSPKEIALGAGVSVTTVYNYKKQELDDPKGTAPPNVETEGSGKTRRISRKSKPITEETAGNLCAGIFAIAAMMDGPEWFLSQEEKSALASPLADSLRILPAPIAEGVNLYSAPVVFVTTLSTIMYAKGRKRAFRGSRPPLRIVNPLQQNSSQGTGSSSQTATNAAPPESAANGPMVASRPATVTATTEMPNAVIAAAEAARGGLQNIDEIDTGAGELS